MNPKDRPTEWAASLTAAIFGVLTAWGIDVPDALPAAVTALVAVLVTGGVATFNARALPPDTVTEEDLSDGYQDDL